MEGPGSNPPRRRAGDSNTPYGGPAIRDWQKNTWYGPAPTDTNPFDEPESAPELLELRSDNVREKAGEFWQDQSRTGYQSAIRSTRKGNTATAKVKKQKETGDRSRVIARAAAAVIAVAVITAAVLYFGVYRIREIRVEGNILISREDIIAMSGIRKNESILTLNEAEISRNILNGMEAKVSESKKQNPNNPNYNYYLLQFRYLERQMPGTVIISVKEREPCCKIRLRGITYVMDKKRFVVFETEDENISSLINLVQVKGLNVRTGSKAGQTIVLESASQQRLFDDLFLEMKVLGCTAMIREVDLSNETKVLLQTREGYTVNMGDCSSDNPNVNRIHAKLRSMLLVQEELKNLGQAGGTIDVRMPESPYYAP